MIAILQHNSDVTRSQPGRFSNDTLAPTSGTGALLGEMFPYRWSWIEAPNTVSRPSWRTENRYALSPFQLWDKWSDPALLVGVSFGPNTRYGLLDIDARSPYHAQLRAVTDALEDIGINKTVLVRSSHSGGYHLYFFLPEPVSTFELACVVRWALHRAGMEIKDGHLEQFPNTKAYDAQYRSHRLPLQPNSGSFLLDDDGLPWCDRITYFHQLAQTTAQAQDLDTLREAMPKAKSWWKAKQRRTAQAEAVLAAWRRDLENAQLQGWTGPGQTNELLGKIAAYGRVFLGYEGQKLASYIQRTAEDCPGFKRWCQHVQQIARKAWDWAKSAMHRYWTPGTRKSEESSSEMNKNETLRRQAQVRIANAVNELVAEGCFPETVSGRVAAIRAKAKCSPATLYRNLSIWHPDHIGENVCNPPTGEANSASDVTDSDTSEALLGTSDRGVTDHASNEGYAGLKMTESHSNPCPGAAPLFQPSPFPPPVASPDPNLRRYVTTLRNRYAAAQWAGNGYQMEAIRDEIAGLGLQPDVVLAPGWDGEFV